MELRRKNKKGMFFTLIAIALLSLLMISVTIFSVAKERESINKRIESMNNYVFSLEEDLLRKTYISGFRIIFLFEKRMLETGLYMNDVDATFDEAFFNGTINGVINLDEIGLMEGIKFSDIEEDLNIVASKINVKIDLSNPSISVNQVDPWNVKVSLTVDMLIEDISGLASWNKTSVFNAYIPIKNFEDPLYLINTNGKIAHKISMTPYTSSTFVVGGDVSNLADHLDNFYYINSSDAPNFLNRLEGNLSADANGIESLVNIQKLFDAGVGISDRVIVDHIYFSNDNPSGHTVSGMPSWFKLDNGHLGIYGV